MTCPIAVSECNPKTVRKWSVLMVATSLVLTACNMSLIKPVKMSERRSQIPGARIQRIAVIASDDQTSTLRMSATVRQQLNDAGLTAMRRAGRWSGESDAVTEICQPGQEQTVDGVLFVSYNRLTLRHCESKLVAYEIAGGQELGLEDLAKRLIGYLRPPAQ